MKIHRNFAEISKLSEQNNNSLTSPVMASPDLRPTRGVSQKVRKFTETSWKFRVAYDDVMTECRFGRRRDERGRFQISKKVQTRPRRDYYQRIRLYTEEMCGKVVPVKTTHMFLWKRFRYEKKGEFFHRLLGYFLSEKLKSNQLFYSYVIK